MKRATIVAATAIGLLVLASSTTVSAQQPNLQSVTLYSVIKYRDESRPACLNLVAGEARPNYGSGRCDVYYGFLYAGDEWDWLQSSGTQGSRSVIKDLGELAWTASITVPVVAALPKLKSGEQRQVTVDTSGADGADGAPGAPGAPGRNGADADGIVRERQAPVAPPLIAVAPATKAKRDGTPKIDPMFIKARLGHLYVIHVVDDVNDFYALFRVEALERGDKCTISWKLIPAPDARIAQE